MVSTCLNKLESILGIKIPNGVVAFLFAHACEHILDSDGLVDTDKDSGGVEHDEHDDGEYEYHGMVGIKLLMAQSLFYFFSCKS